MIYLHTLFLVAVYFVSAIFPIQAKDHGVETKYITDKPVSKISYSSSGGRSGNYESLDIAEDSVIYVQAHRGSEKTRKEKTVKSFWKSLTKTINLKDFKKIKTNPGHALYDGIDVTISIEKGDEKYSIVNGNEDSLNYRKIRPLTTMLEKKLAELRKKITW
jgi:hypothetical protein